MKTKVLKTIATILLLLLIAFPLADCALAQRKPEPPANPPIPEDQRPWPGIPWIMGIVLGGGIFITGLKNAKKTHLD